ncbi:MAG: hypothetical protein A3F25_00505 [Candidatus Yanofskybacteria bacterium RIFCSPHIGHO2_12_FULL_45_19b]|uniref:Integrase catalytic domain-containing protein n=1 Tax=Candidatus Yanofskybacteria bacterium RIFCSPHIGHO2_12_FULL_45_19b TaxID=1802689 RepID=A0A1F8G445_9BACT|nr:MAG: hypothetical protein A3F25_00505 [Candidatus Yanofskybacteria bacterium RIFCSPHIGHO2_12_FULL_45_19b]
MRRVAKHIGVQASTVSRWMKRSTQAEARIIPTRSSAAIGRPTALAEAIVERIVQIRKQTKRCAQVVHAQLLRENIKVSLSSVERTLRRKGLVKTRSKWKKYHLSGMRPMPEKPGILVETDTINVYLNERKRIYIFTLIDCCSRWAYARASQKLSARLAQEFILAAQRKASFRFQCVQSDHGSEFSHYFTKLVQTLGTRHRHCRVRKPNDNAHVERFNRTIQEDLQKEIYQYKTNLPLLNRKIERYLDYYNNQRLHMGIKFQTPAEVLQRS